MHLEEIKRQRELMELITVTHDNFVDAFDALRFIQETRPDDAPGRIHVVIGARRSGKSHLGRTFVETMSRADDWGGQLRPAALVTGKSLDRGNAMRIHLLAALGIELSNRHGSGHIMKCLEVQMREQQTRTFVIDDAGALLSSRGPERQIEAIDQLNEIVTNYGCDVICIGDAALPNLFVRDGIPISPGKEIRIEPYLRNKGDDEHFRQAMDFFLGKLPILAPTPLSDTLFARCASASSGLFGRFAEIVKEAAISALEEGDEDIGVEELAEAYRMIYRVADEENPFLAAEPVTLQKKKRPPSTAMSAAPAQALWPIDTSTRDEKDDFVNRSTRIPGRAPQPAEPF